MFLGKVMREGVEYKACILRFIVTVGNPWATSIRNKFLKKPLNSMASVRTNASGYVSGFQISLADR